jgi:predicted aspartyl protease
VRRGTIAGLLLIAAITACTFSREISVHGHQLMAPLPGGLVNSVNIEEQLRMGMIPEVLEFLSGPGARVVDSTRGARVAGRALLERGDFTGALPLLERAHAEEGRLQDRAETAWAAAQAYYWLGRFEESARWARTARAQGLLLPEGWVTFLDSAGGKPLYGGAPEGARLVVKMAYDRPRIPRLLTKVNDRETDAMVFDTGASLSLLTESAAARMGVERVEGATASAVGLHRAEIPMGFGWARTVRIGDLTLEHVPFGILPDDALTFGASGIPYSFDGVLGVHLLKELDWHLDYENRQVRAVRLVPGMRRGSRAQNVFFRRLKPMVRASLNQEPWFLFLLDTGSEPTMLTRHGVERAHFFGSGATYPMTLEGIGQSRVSWGKLSKVTVGVERYMVRFADIIVKEEGEGIEDGVLGSSFLANFDVAIRFSTMTMSLERPIDRKLREQAAAAEGSPSPF